MSEHYNLEQAANFVSGLCVFIGALLWLGGVASGVCLAGGILQPGPGPLFGDLGGARREKNFAEVGAAPLAAEVTSIAAIPRSIGRRCQSTAGKVNAAKVHGRMRP